MDFDQEARTLISEIVYHGAEGEPLVAHGLLVPCPCCGHSLMLSARLLASTPAPAAPSLSEHTEAAAAADGHLQPSAAKASGLPLTVDNLRRVRAEMPSSSTLMPDAVVPEQMPPEERLYRAAVDVLHGGRRFGSRRAWRELRAAVEAVGEKRRHESVAIMPADLRPGDARFTQSMDVRLKTHEDCAQYQAYYRGAPNGRCCDPELGGGMPVPANGPACRIHYVEGWRDGNDD